MVTRGIRFLFNEGERVLCYEPDPNKAKVLYDSKILECKVTKDTLKGKKQYLVHFFGWNSSWDRCVTEDAILKDTPENRMMQRHLAEDAAQQLKITIKNKKIKLNKIPAILKEAVLNCNSNDDDEDEEEDDDEEEEEEESQDDDKLLDELSHGSIIEDDETSELLNIVSESISENSVSDHSESSTGLQTPIEPLPDWTPLPEELKSVLDKDYLDTIVQRLDYSIPFKITVIDILQDFKKAVDEKLFAEWVPNFTPRIGVTRAACNNPQPFPELPLLVDEFVNSTKTYFDAIFRTHLCYSASEKDMYTQNYEHLNPSECFGVIHLLRFLVVLPEFMALSTSIPRKQMQILANMFECFTHYLSRNHSKFML